MLTKLSLYTECGIDEYWIVDPINEQILIYSLAENEIADSKTYSKAARHTIPSVIFDGLEADLKEVFA